jgi:hypothetical protein
MWAGPLAVAPSAKAASSPTATAQVSPVAAAARALVQAVAAAAREARLGTKTAMFATNRAVTRKARSATPRVRKAASSAMKTAIGPEAATARSMSATAPIRPTRRSAPKTAGIVTLIAADRAVRIDTAPALVGRARQLPRCERLSPTRSLRSVVRKWPQNRDAAIETLRLSLGAQQTLQVRARPAAMGQSLPPRQIVANDCNTSANCRIIPTTAVRRAVRKRTFVLRRAAFASRGRSRVATDARSDVGSFASRLKQAGPIRRLEWSLLRAAPHLLQVGHGRIPTPCPSRIAFVALHCCATGGP